VGQFRKVLFDQLREKCQSRPGAIEGSLKGGTVGNCHETVKHGLDAKRRVQTRMGKCCEEIGCREKTATQYPAVRKRRKIRLHWVVPGGGGGGGNGSKNIRRQKGAGNLQGKRHHG